MSQQIKVHQKYRNLFTFSIYHQPVVPHPNISVYHLAMKIIRWQSTYHLTQLTLRGWTFHHWSSEYGNIWRTIGTRPSCTKLADIPTVPIAHLYKHMITNNRHVILFTISNESADNTASICTLFSHTGIYIMALGSLIPARLGIFCCYFFLVLTCQISMLTFTIRFYVTYYCGWWCRGSTHLQI